MLPETESPPPSETAFDSAATARPPSWLREALRLLTLRPTDGTALTGSAASIAIPASVAFASWAGFDWLNNLPDARFFPYALPAVTWYVLAALLVAVALALISRPTVSLARACSLLAPLAPAIVIAQFVIERFVPERWIQPALGGVALYAAVYCFVGLRSIAGNRQIFATVAGAAVAVLTAWLGNVLYVSPMLWTSGDDPEGEYADLGNWDAAEPVLFQQSARIDASVAKLVRPADDAPVGFFVGFAGNGQQKVFAEEIEFAAERFAKRYDTTQRTLLLVNDRRSLEKYPLASGTALTYALKGVASKMHLDRDVLFLALSSHGSEDPLLSVTNSSLPLRDLSGEMLAEALRESGIKWRVIVISACHAGAFIDPLKDENTILITAAAADRSSFGCADDRDLTYFGEAFYRDALPAASSLRDAFDKAKVLIAEREQEEGVEASLPQAYFGEQLEKQLAVMSKDRS